MKIVLAGGTILKDYDVDAGTIEHRVIILDECLDDMMLKNKPEIYLWEIHDSLEMRKPNRKSLYQYCENLQDDRLLVIHGTDTMSETHEYFCGRPLLGTVVFTGAFFPLCIRGTDGEFNLGFGMACAKVLPRGNYVAINGEVFTRKVKKNFENLEFEGKML
tara:strand:- start:18089 stop:18571 length:483 start_codon:yes stop_codon:yes gene_type:complete